MDLSNFVTYDKKEFLLLSIANSKQEIVENTHSKPQKTLQFKMTKKEFFFIRCSSRITRTKDDGSKV